ncbi:hypothetical protein BJP35_2405 [Enterobacter sp. J49]|nr:hypothetical protein BJP35_2405 [Enterobacter sp. J49]
MIAVFMYASSNLLLFALSSVIISRTDCSLSPRVECSSKDMLVRSVVEIKSSNSLRSKILPSPDSSRNTYSFLIDHPLRDNLDWRFSSSLRAGLRALVLSCNSATARMTCPYSSSLASILLKIDMRFSLASFIRPRISRKSTYFSISNSASFNAFSSTFCCNQCGADLNASHAITVVTKEDAAAIQSGKEPASVLSASVL